MLPWQNSKICVMGLVVNSSNCLNGQKSANLNMRASSFFCVSCMGAGPQGFRLSSTAFPNQKQGTGWEKEQWNMNQHPFGTLAPQCGGSACCAQAAPTEQRVLHDILQGARSNAGSLISLSRFGLPMSYCVLVGWKCCVCGLRKCTHWLCLHWLCHISGALCLLGNRMIWSSLIWNITNFDRIQNPGHKYLGQIN